MKRRSFLLGAGSAALSLAGCASTSRTAVSRPTPAYASLRDDDGNIVDGTTLYAARPEEAFPLPAIPYQKINPRYYRQMVRDPTGQPPGTLVVDTGNHFLYFTYPDGRAMRYGVGLGRAGFSWAGRGVIQYKRQWPRWVPPDEMIARQPELAPYQADLGGMPPGLTNPLGARALYIFADGEDTQYRLHGSPEWWTIGKNVSSGCVRFINQDIIDLYDRVPNKTQILVTNLDRPLNEIAAVESDEPVISDEPRMRDPLPIEDDQLLGPVDDVSVW